MLKQLLLRSTLFITLALGLSAVSGIACADGDTPQGAPTATAAPSVTKQVKQALKADPSLGASKVKVSNKKGVITLNGWVANKDQSDKIADTVSKVPGVKSVVNHLQTADSLAGQVKAALSKDATLRTFNLGVRESSGNVTLFGSVQEQGQADKAAEIAKSVSGVTGVTNHINVMQTN
ncbi:hyperosmotically inducible protein [Silvimonas terrae]|uniref:Hyperosmotically inducible protein n=1 Tax=Silvimonas terrae TaxID=300266 RepID=A0A840REF7_9NEIS|nr:BON domain-containing protein [Silvimonas terrae]MBB5191899.1 hyperosmotically inducible protein [Silvimonas terrae]